MGWKLQSDSSVAIPLKSIWDTLHVADIDFNVSLCSVLRVITISYWIVKTNCRNTQCWKTKYSKKTWCKKWEIQVNVLFHASTHVQIIGDDGDYDRGSHSRNIDPTQGRLTRAMTRAEVTDRFMRGYSTKIYLGHPTCGRH